MSSLFFIATLTCPSVASAEFFRLKNLLYVAMKYPIKATTTMMGIAISRMVRKFKSFLTFTL